jgi:hypothetical protein
MSTSANGLRKAPVVESVNPFKGGKFHRLYTTQRATAVDHLSLEHAIDRFGEHVVVAVSTL